MGGGVGKQRRGKKDSKKEGSKGEDVGCMGREGKITRGRERAREKETNEVREGERKDRKSIEEGWGRQGRRTTKERDREERDGQIRRYNGRCKHKEEETR